MTVGNDGWTAIRLRASISRQRGQVVYLGSSVVGHGVRVGFPHSVRSNGNDRAKWIASGADVGGGAGPLGMTYGVRFALEVPKCPTS